MKSSNFQKEKKFFTQIDNGICVAVVILFAISMIPLVYCAFFNYATGDDLLIGSFVRKAIVDKTGIIGVWKAFIEFFKYDYFGWDGNWFCIVMWAFEPSIFGERVYVITAFVAFAAIMCGSAYFIKHFLNKFADSKRSLEIVLFCLINFLIFQYMPHPRVIYWYTGMVQYLLPFGIYLFAITFLDRFYETGKNRYLASTSILVFLIGGTGYLTTVLTMETIGLFILYHFFLKKEDRKRAIITVIPFICIVVSFLICALSPGIAKRGGDEFGFGLGKVFSTLAECLICPIRKTARYFREVKILPAYMITISVLSWDRLKASKEERRFRYPFIVIMVLYLVHALIFAPELYVDRYESEDVSGGVANTYWMSYVILLTGMVIYLTGWIKEMCIRRFLLREDSDNTHSKKQIIKVSLICLSLLYSVLVFKPVIKNSVGYLCYDFITSGRLSDFEGQMRQRLEILEDESVKDVVLPYMNHEQGPFMHMALTDDPNSYTCSVTARFYGKNSVVAIPRGEWNEIYSGE